MQFGIGVASFLLLVVTALPLSHHPHWLVRSADFPRLQFASLALALWLVAAVALPFDSAWHWLVLANATVCLCWQLCWIFPYTPLWRKEVLASSTQEHTAQITILTCNVLTSNRNVEALLSLVARHEPDVLVTLESDQWWQDRLDALERTMPHSIKCPLDNLYGMHVYSRLPLDEPTIEFLVEDDVPSMHALLRMRNGASVRMHFLHPAPPSPTENEHSSERDAELLVVAKSVAGCADPVIVTGDLNDVAWSSTTRMFRKISGLLDPRVGRGMFNTFHAGIPLLRWPLDHVFHSAHFRLAKIDRLPSIGSDHFPLLARLSLQRESVDEQDSIAMDAAARDRADAIVREQGVAVRDVPAPGD